MTTAKALKREPGKQGRRSKDEEIDLYLEMHGTTRDAVENPDRPMTATEMLAKARDILWADYSSLTGVAKVQAFKALQSLALQDPDQGGADEVEPLLAEIVTGVANLTPERRQEILERELAKLDVERAAIVGAINA